MADTATPDIEVDVPGTGAVSFPGDMSHEDIEKAIRTHPDFKTDPSIPQLSEAPKKRGSHQDSGVSISFDWPDREPEIGGVNPLGHGQGRQHGL